MLLQYSKRTHVQIKVHMVSFNECSYFENFLKEEKKKGKSRNKEKSKLTISVWFSKYVIEHLKANRLHKISNEKKKHKSENLIKRPTFRKSIKIEKNEGIS